MYGTVALLQALPGKTAELIEEVRAEAEEAPMSGYVQQFLYQVEKIPDAFYLVVIFEDKESYHSNANTPAQHERYLRLRALLAEDPEWFDGDLIYPFHYSR